MSRGIGELAPIQEVIPVWGAVVLGLLTQLGDPWFVALVLVFLYWTRPDRRQDVVVLAGLVVAAFGVTHGLKHLFAFPRPAQPLVALDTLPALVRPLYEATAISDGYGFPSGHAFLSTVTYVGLAEILTISTRRRRYLAAAGIVALVCFTRLALGVHFLVDVVAGVVLGLALLFGGRLFVRRIAVERPTGALGLAVGCALFAVVAGPTLQSALILAVSLAMAAGWHSVGRETVEPTT